MILNVRGTNGSGKTTLARAMTGEDAQEVTLFRYNQTSKKTGRVTSRAVDGLRGNGIVLAGAYRHGVPSGGCDCIATQDFVRQAVETAARQSQHVIFEGVIVSTIYQRYADWAEEEGSNLRFGYLDTPLEVCLSNIRKRQEASGKVREIKVDQVEGKWNSIQRCRTKMLEAGLMVYDIPHGDAGYGYVRGILDGTVRAI